MSKVFEQTVWDIFVFIIDQPKSRLIDNAICSSPYYAAIHHLEIPLKESELRTYIEKYAKSDLKRALGGMYMYTIQYDLNNTWKWFKGVTTSSRVLCQKSLNNIGHLRMLIMERLLIFSGQFSDCESNGQMLTR